MNTTALTGELYEFIAEMEIIDCHEHLYTEQETMGMHADFSTFFSHYCLCDLISAGITEEERILLFADDTPFEQKWTIFSRYYPLIEDTGYTRAARIALKKYYGIEEVTADSCRELPGKIREFRRPGFFDRIFGDCRIRHVVNNAMAADEPYGVFFPAADDRFRQAIRPPFVPCISDFRQEGTFFTGVRTVSDLEDRVQWFMQRFRQADGCAIKIMGDYPWMEVSRNDAAAALKRMNDGVEDAQSAYAVYWYMLERVLDDAAKDDIPSSVHTGYWNDFRQQAPEKYLPLICRHPKNRFDLFHLGYPYVKSSLLLAKTYPTVFIDLCWTYIISPHFAGDAIRQIVDFLPLNKVMGFGGDYRVPEKIFGHREMMNRTMSRALADGVADGTLTMSRAKCWAKAMLRDNPASYYGL